jgi:hypothetical protein
MIRSVVTYLAILTGITCFAGLFVLIFGNSTKIVCARESGRPPNCKLTTILLGSVPLRSREVQGVTDVRWDEDCDDGCSYRALLVTESGGSVPIDIVYTNAGPVERQIDAVSAFLQSDETAFSYSVPVQWWAVIMLAVMELVGVGFVASRFLKEARRGR